MKALMAGLLALLLLTGCAATPQGEPAAVLSPETTATASDPSGLWEMGHPLEVASQGALRVYPLEENAYAIYAMGESLLLLSGGERTRLTRLSGEALEVSSITELDFFLEPEALTVTATGLSFFDPGRNQMVVLDTSLKEIRHIDFPAESVRSPLLSQDGETLFYCTDTAIRAWDLNRDISRTVVEMEKGQTLTGIYRDGTILQCRTEDGVQLRNAQDGRLLWEGAEILFSTDDDRYYAVCPADGTQSLIFGLGEDTPLALTPADSEGDTRFLPRQNAALSLCPVAEGQIRLDYYDLATGRRTACLPIRTDGILLDLEGTDSGWVYLLTENPEGRKTIYRWDPKNPAVNDGTVYTGPYYTADDPNYHGLLALQAQAAEIGEKYGLDILLWDDALLCQSWDYDLEAEYRIPLLEVRLSQLDIWLSQFPSGFLATTAENFSALKICLVRSITGTPESGSLDKADGIQFFSDTNAYIALAAGDATGQTFYHELYHVMETQLLNKSTALDQWDNLNPAGFSYDYDYAANATREVGSWLDADIRCFVDQYAMSYPKEDRARLFEYAMVPGSEGLFAASPLQHKLKTLCLGIREAYDLKTYPEPLPWEQYLLQSLAPA